MGSNTGQGLGGLRALWGVRPVALPSLSFLLPIPRLHLPPPPSGSGGQPDWLCEVGRALLQATTQPMGKLASGRRSRLPGKREASY